MSHQDKHNEQISEKQIQDAYQELSNETTSSELDQKILAMAEQQHPKMEVEKVSFVSRFFRSKQVKYLVSMSAALVMTVGIARFMVYLGKTDQGPAQNSDTLLADQADNEGFAFELAEEVAAAPAEATRQAVPEQLEPPELLTQREMQRLTEEKDRLAQAKMEERTIMVTGSRIRSSEAVTTAEAEEKAKKTAAEQGSGVHAGVLDEAIDTAPKPAEWLSEILELLEKGDKNQAVEEWSQFKNTYPEYQLDSQLEQQFRALGLFD